MKRFLGVFSITLITACPAYAVLPQDLWKDGAPAHSYAAAAPHTAAPCAGEALHRLSNHPFFQKFFPGPELPHVVARWVTEEKSIHQAYAARIQQLGSTYDQAFEQFSQFPQDLQKIAQWAAHKTAQALYTKQIKGNDEILEKYAQEGFHKAQAIVSLTDVVQDLAEPTDVLRLFHEIADSTGFGELYHVDLSNGYWRIANDFLQAKEELESAASKSGTL